MVQFRTHRRGFVSTILVLCLLSPLVAWAGVAGKVIFKSGVASVRHVDNSVIEAQKDLPLMAGDTIETQEGRVQLSLIDGGKVSLQPNTIYKISKYEFSGKEDGSEYAFTELIKGGLRTITGWVGHKNPERYQLKTAVATIGIRGTEFTLNLNGDHFLMTTNQGSVDVCNGAGCLNASAGMSIAVNGSGDKPKFSKAQAVSRAKQPNANSAGSVESSKPVFAAADKIGDDGLPEAINDDALNEAKNKQLANFNGKAMVATLMKTNCACGVDDVYEAGLKMNNLSRPVEIDNNNVPTIISPVTFDAINSGTDGIVSWGRATGSFKNGATDEPFEWMDYIVGAKPPPGQLNNLTGTYNVFASTAPMFVDVNGLSTPVGAVNTTTGSLTFDFGTSLYNYNLNVQTVGENYLLAGSDSLGKNNPSFAASGTVTSIGATCGGESVCSQALQDGAHLIQGAFFGKKGERAGMQYGFTVPTGAIYGSAVLK